MAELTTQVPVQSEEAGTQDRYVVDTGVFLRWYVDQNGYEHARDIQIRFARDEVVLVTTDLARIELAHVLRTKGLIPGHLDRQSYLDAVGMLDAVGIAIRVTEPAVLVRAAGWAVRWNLRIYDALFVDLALSTGYQLLTSDARLARAIGHVVPVEVLQGI